MQFLLNQYAALPERFYSKQQPATVPAPVLLRTNEKLAEELGIDPAWLTSEEAVQIFSGNRVPESAQPIAQAYAGHQFGGFVPQLGDGRAILLGELKSSSGKIYDVQLKGAGRTAFSRGGDGKSALGPVLREYIVSEAMHAMGVPTTRALAAIATGEVVAREQPAPGGILTRVASSHVRVGTFQYFAARKDQDALELLVKFCIRRHFPEASEDKNPARALLRCVVRAQAELIAKWMSFGFIHGVMNTDNCAISGETIDYGPCAFMDRFHPDCVFSYIDRNARYAWGNQPTMAHWNLTRLAEAMLPVLDSDREKAEELAQEELAKFATIFTPAYLGAFEQKFGLAPSTEVDGHQAFIKKSLGLMASQGVDFTLFFRRLTSLASHEDKNCGELFSDPSAFSDWLETWRTMPKSADYKSTMKAVNPIRIPRNHRIEQVIQAAYQGDYAPFEELNQALAQPFEEREEFARFEAAPLPHEEIKNTFCGT